MEKCNAQFLRSKYLIQVIVKKNPLKPSNEELKQALTQYFSNSPSIKSELEELALITCCSLADSIYRKVAKIALQDAPPSLKTNLIVHLSANQSLSPIATTVGDNEAFRVSIPIYFIHRLLSVAPTRNGREPSILEDYYVPSILIAAMAAYAHELTHVFIGHLVTSESSAQEAHADYMGGALTWSWLHNTDIQTLVGISPADVEENCIFAFLHLASIFSDQLSQESLYLPRVARMLVYAGGAAFAADNRDIQLAQKLETAVHALPKIPNSLFSSEQIESEFKKMNALLTEEVFTKLGTVLKNVQREKRSWYDLSQHLKPIKKPLNHIVKRDKKDPNK